MEIDGLCGEKKGMISTEQDCGINSTGGNIVSLEEQMSKHLYSYVSLNVIPTSGKIN